MKQIAFWNSFTFYHFFFIILLPNGYYNVFDKLMEPVWCTTDICVHSPQSVFFLVMMIFGFITIGQSVNMGVVEQALVTFTPWETLGAYTQVVVFNEFSAWLGVIFYMAQIRVDQAQTNGWNSNEE